MPELPEVQTVVTDLIAAGLTGKTIRKVAVFWPRSVAPVPVSEFCRRLSDRSVENIGRRGKYIVIGLSGDLFLLIHLRMTGRLVLSSGPGRCDKHEHVVCKLDDGTELRLHDTRKFARMSLTNDPAQTLRHLGPEPLSKSFTARMLGDILHSRRRILKPLLLDQSQIAGLGNIYCDETLWRAGLHPLLHSQDLGDQQVRRLHLAMRSVLRKALRNSGTSLGSGEGNFANAEGQRGRHSRALEVFHRTGQPCRRCGATIERIVVAQRSTHICPHCQTP